MIDFVNTVRGSDHRWSERHGLMQMALLLPELQVA
jgi:hypothetical protein